MQYFMFLMCSFLLVVKDLLGRVRLGYSGIRIYSGIYSGYSVPGSRIAGMKNQVFRNENSCQTNAYSHYSNYSYSGLIPNERALSFANVVLMARCAWNFIDDIALVVFGRSKLRDREMLL